FTGKVQRIARVHQFGLKDAPNKNSKTITYPVRQLVGVSDYDIKMIMKEVYMCLSNNGI
ncbi:TPA: phage virion morphogenesis protein, partial [Enterobacter roggenkampii]